MYVCVCRAVTDKQLRDAVNNGATSVRAVSEATGAMTQCGKCGEQAVEIIKAALNLKHESSFNNQTHVSPLHTSSQQENSSLFFEVA